MRRIVSTAQGRVAPVEKFGPDSWMHIEAPDDEDLELLESLDIPKAMLDHARDVDERPRVYREGELLMLVVNFPCRQRGHRAPFTTNPLSIFVVDGRIVTVSPGQPDFLTPLLEGKVAELTSLDPTRFILRLMWQLADAYLAVVREINAAVDRLEERLRLSLRNQEVMTLLDFQKSLTYFTTAMRANELVLERLQKMEALQWSDEDRDLLEDLEIEMRQAIEMVDISANILSQMMDAFTSIVSNNLGSVIKVLTSVTILLAIPMVITSFYGMNVLLPGAKSPMAFTAMVLFCVVLCIGLAVFFRRRNWL